MRSLSYIKRYRFAFLVMVLFLAIGGVLPAGLPGISFVAQALTQDTDGYYQVGNYQDLQAMKTQIDSGGADDKYKLTGDVG